MLIFCLLRNKRFGSFRPLLVQNARYWFGPRKTCHEIFLPLLVRVKSRFANTCTATGFVSGDGIRNLVLPSYLIKTAFRSMETQFQRPGNYSLLQINECRKQCRVIVRTTLHSGVTGFESTLYYQMWLYSSPLLSQAHSALLPSTLFLFTFYSHLTGVHSMFLYVSISLCSSVYLHTSTSTNV